MKQMIFLITMMCYFIVRSLADPFWAIFLYYSLAVLRPQAVWEWALSSTAVRDVRWSLIAAIVSAAAIFLNLSSLRHRIVQKRFMIIIVLFGACLGGSYYFAINHEVAGHYGWEYFKILIMLFMACYVVTERWHVRYLGWMIFVCLIYLVYEVNMLYVVRRRLDIYHTGFGGLDNNGAALLLGMVIPFCYCLFYAERRWWRWGFLLCIPPALHAVMLTYSRGAMLSVLVVGTAMLLWMARRHLVSTLVIGVLLGGVVLGLAGPQVRHRFSTISDNTPGSSQDSRFRSWRAGWNIAKDYPIFGAGLRNSNLLSKAYGADIEGRTIHNVYIQIAADAGFPAAFLFVSLVLVTLWHLLAASVQARRHLDDPEMRWHHYICLASFWSLSIYAFGSIFLSSEMFEICYLLMLFGAVAPTLAKSSDDREEQGDALPVIPRKAIGSSRLNMRGTPA